MNIETLVEVEVQIEELTLTDLAHVGGGQVGVSLN